MMDILDATRQDWEMVLDIYEISYWSLISHEAAMGAGSWPWCGGCSDAEVGSISDINAGLARPIR